jgi:hypothetical protein
VTDWRFVAKPARCAHWQADVCPDCRDYWSARRNFINGRLSAQPGQTEAYDWGARKHLAELWETTYAGDR